MTINEQKFRIEARKNIAQGKTIFYIRNKDLNIDIIKEHILDIILDYKDIYLIKDINITKIHYTFYYEYKIVIQYLFNIEEEKQIEDFLEKVKIEKTNKADIIIEIYKYLFNTLKYNKKQHNFIHFLNTNEGDYYCISLLMHLLLNKFKIKNLIMEGYLCGILNRNYLWNFVEIDNEWYNIDLSLDIKNNTCKNLLICDGCFYNHLRHNDFITDDFYNKYKSAVVNYGTKRNDNSTYLNVKQIKIKQI